MQMIRWYFWIHRALNSLKIAFSLSFHSFMWLWLIELFHFLMIFHIDFAIWENSCFCFLLSFSSIRARPRCCHCLVSISLSWAPFSHSSCKKLCVSRFQFIDFKFFSFALANFPNIFVALLIRSMHPKCYFSVTDYAENVTWNWNL